MIQHPNMATPRWPVRFTGEVGFDEAVSRRLGVMLAFADVQGARL